MEPYKYGDFKFMKSDLKEKTPISKLAKAVDVALELIEKKSDELCRLDFKFKRND